MNHKVLIVYKNPYSTAHRNKGEHFAIPCAGSLKKKLIAYVPKQIEKNEKHVTIYFSIENVSVLHNIALTLFTHH